MKSSERDPVTYIEDIVLSMQRALEYVDGLDLLKFKQDHKTVDAVVRNFEIIGEASKNLPRSVKSKYPQMPWDAMYRLRNRISHEYFGIDHEILWSILTKHLPQNLIDICEILEAERGSDQKNSPA